MIKFKQRNKLSSINPSGFTGFIIKNSNVIIDNSFIKKGTSFINVFDNSNTLLRDCGTISPTISSADIQYQKLTYKLNNEINKKLLPFWYNYNLVRDRSSQFLNYVPSDGVRLQPVAISGSNENRLMTEPGYDKVDEYRTDLVETSMTKTDDLNIEKNYNYISKIIERRVLDDDIDTRDIDYTSYGGYALTSLNSSIKTVFPLSKYKLNLSDSPNILLSLKTRAFLPILKDDNDNESKIYLLSGNYPEGCLLKYDKYNLPIKLIDENLLHVDTVDNYFNDLFIHKYIASSKNSRPLYDVDESGNYKNFSIQYNVEKDKYDELNSNIDIPYLDLEEAIQSGNSTFFFTGPYTIYNVAYKVINDDGTMSVNVNGNEPLTFYVKINDETGEVSSLFDILNTPSSNFNNDQIYNSYFKNIVSDAKQSKQFKFNIKTVEDNTYQPNHMNEIRNLGGFYDTNYEVGIINDLDSPSGKLYDQNGKDITDDLINMYLSSFADVNDITSIDEIDNVKSTVPSSYIDNLSGYLIEFDDLDNDNSLITTLNKNISINKIENNEVSAFIDCDIKDEDILSGNTEISVSANLEIRTRFKRII